MQVRFYVDLTLYHLFPVCSPLHLPSLCPIQQRRWSLLFVWAQDPLSNYMAIAATVYQLQRSTDILYDTSISVLLISQSVSPGDASRVP